MSIAKPQTVMCRYRVKRDHEGEFRKLLEHHWPKLRELGMVTDAPSLLFRGLDTNGEPFFVEIFDWKSADLPAKAHEHPEVMAIWEPMDALCESRDGLPNMEFPHVERVKL